MGNGVRSGDVVGAGAETWSPHYISCDGFPDGYHEAGCWGKAVCVNGQPQVTQCAIDEMYDFDSDTCVSRSQQLISTACNQVMDCSKKPSGRYADQSDGCRSYFICMQGAFFGRMYCPPSTLFNEALQVCDYPGDVPSPCGSHVGPYASTPGGPYPDISA
ncbi:uncharacterized protein LOC143287899 [Babylonia areolata]|uniref:uncharacterized protein LOC143287899 n=1 Tax=Babylonia areolata TaxID=304850 RepID=UPI003FCF281E